MLGTKLSVLTTPVKRQNTQGATQVRSNAGHVGKVNSIARVGWRLNVQEISGAESL
jgi:hypothetical protein